MHGHEVAFVLDLCFNRCEQTGWDRDYPEIPGNVNSLVISELRSKCR